MFNYFIYYCWINIVRCQVDNVVYIGDGGDDFFIGDDNVVVGVRQIQFGKIYVQYDIWILQWVCFIEDDIWEWDVISVINYQWNVVLIRQCVKFQ